MKDFLLPFVLALLVTISTSKISYDGHEILRVNMKKDLDKTSLKKIVDQFSLDVWSDSRSYVDIRVKSGAKNHIRKALVKNRLQFQELIPNIGKLIREEKNSSKCDKFSIDRFNTFEQIETYLKVIAATNSNATLKSIGKTVEKRHIWQMKFSVGSGKPAVWVDCNIHAREWITGATCIYGVHLLATSYGTNPNVTSLLNKYDVYIIPIVNPDGYVYSFIKDRLWRKNRNKYDCETELGVDLNRNFDDHFGIADSSEDSCSPTYRGPSPASEPETKAIQAAIVDLVTNANLKVLFSLHSYSQFWLYPFGWTADLPPEAKELERISVIGVNALTAVNGTQYYYGSISAIIYPVSGNSLDFSYKSGIVHSYTLELRDKYDGRYGFLLPEYEILPTSKETWAGLIAATLAI